MSRKPFIFCLFSVFLLTVFLGCQSAKTTGRDPLLGKTRLDPPSTSARSVYVERQNLQESGVVPGSGQNLAVAPVPAAAPASTPAASTAYAPPTGSPTVPETSATPAAPTADGTYQTVHYPNFGEDSAPEQDAANGGSHLKWRSIQTEPTSPESVPTSPESVPTSQNLAVSAETPSITPEELANYQYIYDFSTFPARKVPVRSPSAAADPYQAPETVQNQTADGVSSTVSVVSPKSAPATAPPARCKQLVANQFDPYAPNRQFERRRANLSQSFANDFDSASNSFAAQPNAQPNAPLNAPVALQPSVQLAGTAGTAGTAGLPGTSDSVRAATLPTSTGGWQIVSTPTSGASAVSQSGFSELETLEQSPQNTQNAPISPVVGSSVILSPSADSLREPRPGNRNVQELDLLELEPRRH